MAGLVGFPPRLASSYTLRMASPEARTSRHTLSEQPADAWSVDDLHALGRDTEARRRIAAYLLAVPERTRPTSRAVAAMLGVSEATVRMDWTRSDVRALARSATSAGLVALMLASARGLLVALCARADAGDLEASRELRAWLRDLGALDRVTAPGSGDDAGTGHAAGALASADAAEALAAALAALAPVEPLG